MKNKTAYIWGLFSRFAPSGIQLLTNMYLARILLPKDFGTIGVLAIIYTVANTLIDAGLGGSLVKEEKLESKDFATITTFNLLMGTILYFIVFSCSGLLEEYFTIDGLSKIIKILSLPIIIGSFAVVPNALLIKACSFNKIFRVSMISIITASVCSIIMANLGVGLYTLVWYQLIYTTTQTLCSNLYAGYRITFGFSIESMKKLLPFGIFTSFITVVDAIYENILISLTGKYLNVQKAGYVSQSKRLDDTLSYSIAMTIGTVTFPILTKLKSKQDEFIREANSIYKTITMLLVPMLLVVAIFSTEIMVLLFGKQWVEAGPYLNGFMFAGIFLVLEALLNGFIKALCYVDKLALVTIIKRILGIFIIILTLIYSPENVIYGYIISTAIGFLANCILFSRILQLSFFDRIVKTTIYILPAIFLYIGGLLTKITSDNLIISSLTVAVLCMVYYLGVIRLYGINLLKVLKLQK